MPGIMTSSTTRWGGRSRAMASAALPSGGDVDGVPLKGQPTIHQTQHLRVVIHHQDAWPHHTSPTLQSPFLDVLFTAAVAPVQGHDRSQQR